MPDQAKEPPTWSVPPPQSGEFRAVSPPSGFPASFFEQYSHLIWNRTLECLSFGVVVLTLQQRILFLNGPLARLLGGNISRFIGERFGFCTRLGEPDNRFWQLALKGENKGLFCTFINTAGLSQPVTATIDRLFIPEEDASRAMGYVVTVRLGHLKVGPPERPTLPG